MPGGHRRRQSARCDLDRDTGVLAVCWVASHRESRRGRCSVRHGDSDRSLATSVYTSEARQGRAVRGVRAAAGFLQQPWKLSFFTKQEYCVFIINKKILRIKVKKKKRMPKTAVKITSELIPSKRIAPGQLLVSI
jgi:hypothetical protein